jgi:tRNA threonylcarbamoyladenosine biosynthesis protein TsaB
MPNLLALDTSTEACSVALLRDGEITEIFEVVPRQHSQRLFGMLQELLPSGRLSQQGIDAVVYAEGPGSFTGLRVCASAVQGLCFANGLPAIAVGTLEAQAWTALREGLVRPGEYLLSTLDAQIGELYWSLHRAADNKLQTLQSPRVARPEACAVEVPAGALVAVGSGLTYQDALPAALRGRLQASHPQLLPHARDLLPAALCAWAAGETQAADAVCPVYVRDEISWKKLSEQGKTS